MKKIALVSAIALSGLIYNSANAQILQIGLRLGGHRPMVEASLAAPAVAVDYNNANDYYYLPDVDAYYSVPEQAYYYNNGDSWVSAAYLPGEYRNYDWRNARHFEVRAPRPFLHADFYRDRFNGRAYDWRAYNDRFANRYDDRRVERFAPRPDDRFAQRPDDRFDNRRDDRFDNRNDNRRDFNNDNRMQEQPRFERPYNQPRSAEHADGNNWNNGGNRDQNQGGRGNDNQGGRGNRNDGQGQNNNNQPQRSNSNWQQRSDDHFTSNNVQDGHRGFGRS